MHLCLGEGALPSLLSLSLPSFPSLSQGCPPSPSLAWPPSLSSCVRLCQELCLLLALPPPSPGNSCLLTLVRSGVLALGALGGSLQAPGGPGSCSRDLHTWVDK